MRRLLDLGTWWLLAATGAVGLVLMWTGALRLGAQVLAGALVGAAVGRLLLPGRVAGGLAIRSRGLDTLSWLGLAVVVFVVSRVLVLPHR